MSKYPDRLIRVRPDESVTSKRQLNYFKGVSCLTAGSVGISMNRVEIPPGGRADPHHHVGFETAIYILAGRIENFFGEGLSESVVSEAGDFLYIPPGVVHQPVNLSDSEKAIAIISRNLASEDEPVVPYL